MKHSGGTDHNMPLLVLPPMEAGTVLLSQQIRTGHVLVWTIAVLLGVMGMTMEAASMNSNKYHPSRSQVFTVRM